ncbi:ribonuclease J [Parvularcula sp. IMCC14364]|uniref:ribonuclease J n=1 Tax=Parvularcula sp. IMCC14364 TaxID=3067902 RepID=UPI0027414F63|nr:ribonuclease J [Parvularcula sp. IMCC14364]
MKTENELVFLPLGGSGEIGMNMNMYGIGPADARKWLMIDCGVMFGDPRTPGIDLICPDPSYILEDVSRGGGEFLGLVLTHGHEDHIGAVARLWPMLKCPLYATAFTAELVRRKLAEENLIDVPFHIIDMSASFSLGPFDLEFVTLTHSIPEPNGIILRTPLGTVLHTGDWKLDISPTLGPVTDSSKLEALGRDGVMAMVCDSTNVLSQGESGSEMGVKENLGKLIGEQTGRVAVTTFASNVGRLVSICDAAVKNDRAICLLGRSMLRMVDVARQTGILPSGLTFVEPNEAGYLPNNKVLYLCTGSQGEPRAALARIARDDHPDITLGEGDTVIFSSKIIPGNEREIFDLQNALVDQGIRVITEKDEHIHVSGHPCRDELAKMYEWVKPETAIPVHGEARHLEEHAIFARELGAQHSIAPRNGHLIRLAPGRAQVIDEVPSGRLLLDGKVFVAEGGTSIRERRKLSYGGQITVAVVLDQKPELLAPPEVSLAGLPEEDNDGDDFQTLIEDITEEAVDNLPRRRREDDDEITRVVRRAIRDVLMKRWGKRSSIDVLIIRS